MFTLVLPDGWRSFGEARLFATLCILDADAGETVRCPQERELSDHVKSVVRIAPLEQYAGELCAYLETHVACASTLRDVENMTRYLHNPSTETIAAETMLRYIVGEPERTVPSTGHKRKDVLPADHEEEEEPALKRARTEAPAADAASQAAMSAILTSAFKKTCTEEPAADAASLASVSELLAEASALWDKLSPFTAGSESNLIFTNSCAERVCSLLSSKDKCCLRLTGTVGRDIIDKYASVWPRQFFWALSKGKHDYARRLVIPMMRRSSIALVDCVSMICAALAHNCADIVRAMALEFSERRGLPLRGCFVAAWRVQTKLGDGTEVTVHTHKKKTTTKRRVDDVHGLIHVLDAYMTDNLRGPVLSTECLAAAIDYGIIDMQTPATARYAMQSVLTWSTAGNGAEEMQLLLSKVPSPLSTTLADSHMASLISQLPEKSCGAMSTLIKAGIRMTYPKVRSPLSVYVSRNDAEAVRTLLPEHMREGLTRKAQERLIICALPTDKHKVLKVLLEGGVRCRLSEVVCAATVQDSPTLDAGKIGALFSNWLECTCLDSRRKGCSLASGLERLNRYTGRRDEPSAFAAGIAPGASVCAKWADFVRENATCMLLRIDSSNKNCEGGVQGLMRTLSGSTLLGAASRVWAACCSSLSAFGTAVPSFMLPMGVSLDRVILDIEAARCELDEGTCVHTLIKTCVDVLFEDTDETAMQTCMTIAKCAHRLSIFGTRECSPLFADCVTIPLYVVLRKRLPQDAAELLRPKRGVEFALATFDIIAERLEQFEDVRTCTTNGFVQEFSFDFGSYTAALSDVELASALQRDGPFSDALSYCVGMLGSKLFDGTHMQDTLVAFMKTRTFRVTPSIRLRGVHPADVNFTTGVHRVFPMKMQGLSMFSFDAPICTWIWSDEPSAGTQDAECAAGTVGDV